MRRITFSQRVRYHFDNTMTRGAIALIGWLFLLSLVLIVVVSSFVVLLGLAPGKAGFGQVVWWSLMRTLDPGTMGGDEGSWFFLLAMLVVTLGGIFVVSTLIGVINNGLEQTLGELRKGRSLVLEEQHTVILGWSPLVFQIVSELCIANANQRRPAIAILANEDKVRMEDEIRSRIPNTLGTRIICRSGNPIVAADLEIVSPHTSRSIIILSPENDQSDSMVIKTVLAIVNNPNRRIHPLYHIVAAVRNQKSLDVIRMIAGEEVKPIFVSDILARVVAQTSRQSGLSEVYTDLFDFGGDEIYFRVEPSLAGKTFGQALMWYEDSAPIGLQLADRSVSLNPGMDTVLGDGDAIIAISEDDDTVRPSGLTEFPVMQELIHKTALGEQDRESERTLILGWNKSARNVILELDQYVTPGSQMTVVADVLDGAVLSCCKENLKNLAISFREADTTDRGILEDLDVCSYNQVIVLSYSDDLTPEEADSRTLLTLLHLRDIAERSASHFSIVSQMLEVQNRELAEITKADDFIVSGQIISLLLAQLSENAHLAAVFQDLFDAAGSEIYMKPVADYVALDAAVNFYTVVEAARTRGEVAIGYRRGSLVDQPAAGYGVVINPAKSETVSFSAQDRVIVLAES